MAWVAQHHWPPELPQNPVTYSEVVPNNRVEFVPELGRVKDRAEVSLPPEYDISVSYQVTGHQMDLLREFYTVTTRSGRQAVGMPHPQKGRSKEIKDTGDWTIVKIRSLDFNHENGDLWNADMVLRMEV